MASPLHRRGGQSPPNKKYSSAAQSALQTISTYKKKSKQPPLPTSTPLLSESALMDKETNAIYWQDTNILSSSLTRPYLTQRGVVHVRATVLFAVLWLWVWGRISRWLCRRFFEQKQATDEATIKVSIVASLKNLSFTNPILHKLLSVIRPIVQFFLLLAHSLLHIRPPPYPPKLLITTIILYLLESYGCSTRRYLAHGMNGPSELMT